MTRENCMRDRERMGDSITWISIMQTKQGIGSQMFICIMCLFLRFSHALASSFCSKLSWLHIYNCTIIKCEILTLQKEQLHVVQWPFFWPGDHMDSSLHRQNKETDQNRSSIYSWHYTLPSMEVIVHNRDEPAIYYYCTSLKDPCHSDCYSPSTDCRSSMTCVKLHVMC